MKFTITAPAFLPSVEYFIYMLNCDNVLFADHLQYVKRSSLNRSYPLNKGNSITIPVKHSGGITSIKNKEIVNDKFWKSNHLKTIHHQYNTFPFFEEYYFDISNIYHNMKHNLSNTLSETLSFFLKKLKINAQLINTDKSFYNDLDTGIIIFSKGKENSEFFYKNEYMDKGWLNISKISSNQIKPVSIKLIKPDSKLNISILDFLFNYGPEAPFLLRDIQRSCFILN